MSEPIKVFGLEDYQHYFSSASISPQADSETSGEIPISSDETIEVVVESETEGELTLLQNIDTNIQTTTNLSIGIVVALGLLIGAHMGKIFLDKIWR